MDYVVSMGPGGRLNKKDGLTRYGDSHVKDKTVFTLRQGPDLPLAKISYTFANSVSRNDVSANISIYSTR